MQKRARSLVAIVVAAIAVLVAAPVASARDDSVTSFDGTRIVLSFFPAEGLQAGERAPTILIGPGWSSGRDTDENSASSGLFGTTGTGVFRRAGYNVLTWDPRGFGESGGTVEVDSPDYEGRDVQALIDYVARQPEAQLDRAGDPRVGMSGASYGGGIQLVTAAIDSRLDAIAPVIAWHSLVTSLYKAQSPKSGWGIGAVRARRRGLDDPGHAGRARPGTSTRTSPAPTRPESRTGQFSDEDVQWFAVARPGRARATDPDPDAADPGHGRHAVHARRGGHQLPHPARQQGAGQDDLVLRRPRRLPHRRGPGGLRRGPDRALVRPLPEARQVGRHRAAVRVDRRRRPGAHRAGLPAGGAAGGLGVGRRPVRAEPRRGQLRRADRGHAEPARDSHPAERPRRGQPDRRRAEADALVQRPRHQLLGARLRPDRRQAAQHRGRQRGDADPADARRAAAHRNLCARGDRRERGERLVIRAADRSRHVGLCAAARRRPDRHDADRALAAGRRRLRAHARARPSGRRPSRRFAVQVAHVHRPRDRVGA